jgi:hypothetical protein
MNRLLLICVLTVIPAVSASAKVAYVPPAVLIDRADIVVIGKISKIDDTGAGANQEFAIVDIQEVLKGDPKLKSVKQVQPALKGMRLSHRVSVTLGEQGIFILNKVPNVDAYRIGHPAQVVIFNEKNEKDVIASYRKLIADRAKVVGGKAVNGLVARAEVVTEGMRTGVRFSLKNVSDKPITICTWIGGRPLSVRWTGPDGKAYESTHYDWLRTANIRELAKEDFVAIPPGGVLFVAAYGGFDQVFSFKLPEGDSRIVISYLNNADGKQFNIEGVWTGTVVANEITLK